MAYKRSLKKRPYKKTVKFTKRRKFSTAYKKKFAGVKSTAGIFKKLTG